MGGLSQLGLPLDQRRQGEQLPPLWVKLRGACCARGRSDDAETVPSECITAQACRQLRQVQAGPCHHSRRGSDCPATKVKVSRVRV